MSGSTRHAEQGERERERSHSRQTDRHSAENETYDPCGTLQLPCTPITKRNAGSFPASKSGEATIEPPPNCMLATISGSISGFEIRYSPPSRSTQQPPASRIGPNVGDVSWPGKKPLGEFFDWFTHCAMHAVSAAHESCVPVGSAPCVAGVMRKPFVFSGRVGGASKARDAGLDFAILARRSAGAL